MTGAAPKVTRVADGMFRVEHDGAAHTVYVAGPPGRRTAWLRGRLFEEPPEEDPAPRQKSSRALPHSLTAPMPATVRAVLVAQGAAVTKGETLIVLEAMKMELALRAPVDGVVRSIACQVGDLVQPDVPLVDLAPN
jgi:biotin carboxyl carrier protein